MANTFYNRIVRKMVVGFGNIFNNITLVRYNKDQTEQERMLVPIVYSDKENYVRRLQEDAALDKKVQIVLPKMSFEMSGLTYDSSRKLNTNVKNFGQKSTGGIVSQYNPVPYDFDFNLYVYVRNVEDGLQIIEHVLSYFTPDYTIKLNMIPELGMVKEVPIKLNSVVQDVDYEGNRDRETRIIIWTLNFTAKGYIFGGTSNIGVVQTSITNIMNMITPDDKVIFNVSSGLGSYKIGETVYQGFSYGTATATAIVTGWANNSLTLTNVNGNFISSQPIIGTDTNSQYKYDGYNVLSKTPTQIERITVTANNVNANANGYYTYTTTINNSF